MSDTLKDVSVVVPSDFTCGEFEVSGAVILECQDLLASGCPGIPPYEEEAVLYFASLADHAELLAMRSAWLRRHADADDDEEDSSSMSEFEDEPAAVH